MQNCVLIREENGRPNASLNTLFLKMIFDSDIVLDLR
jgi:hypothetical protein